MAANDDIAIASVAAAVKESGSEGEGSRGAVEGSGTLVERFEGLHQKVANAASTVKKTKPSQAGRWWVVPAGWGAVAGSSLLSLALYFRPEPLMRDQDEEGERRFDRLRLAGWVAGAFVLGAGASLLQRRQTKA